MKRLIRTLILVGIVVFMTCGFASAENKTIPNESESAIHTTRIILLGTGGGPG